MSLTHTHTHTVYWSKEEVREMVNVIEKLEKSYEERKPYISQKNRDEMVNRLELLAIGARLLLNPASES